MTSVSRSKRAVPTLLREFVSRPELIEVLDGGADRALTLVCAPPGYGKTLLLAHWARRNDLPCAWVTVDEEDDDPRRLWTAVLASLVACPSVPASSRLRSLVVPRTAVGVDFLTEVLEALAGVPMRIRLVLDDAHHLRSKAALQGLHLLLRHRQDNLRLVLAGRIDPVLPLARLRLEERLCEVRTAQLKFTAQQTATPAERCGLHLTAGQAALLHERTDGWVAGVRLTAMPLRGHPEPDRFLADFSGDERPVAEYLSGEVLANLSEPEADLLRRASITDPVPASLATVLSGRPDAPDMLGALEHSTGLVRTSGEHHAEFRIQQLIRSFLSAELYRHGPGEAARLHRQAAVWWAGQRRPVEALRHVVQGADPGLVTDLLHRWAPQLVARGRHIELQQALAASAGKDSVPDPWVALVLAQIHLAGGDVRAARAEVDRATALGAGPDDHDLARFRTATARIAGLDHALDDHRADESGPGPAEPALAALASVGRAAAALFPGTEGTPRRDVAPVLADLESALATARDQHFGLLEVQCQCLMAATSSAGSDNVRAALAATAAIEAATTHGWQESWWAATAHAVLAHCWLIAATIPVPRAPAPAGSRPGQTPAGSVGR